MIAWPYIMRRFVVPPRPSPQGDTGDLPEFLASMLPACAFDVPILEAVQRFAAPSELTGLQFCRWYELREMGYVDPYDGSACGHLTAKGAGFLAGVRKGEA